MSSWSSADLIPIEPIETHIHLSSTHQHALFGARDLTVASPRVGLQGQCIYKDTVRVAGADGIIDVTIMGPAWEHTQLELTRADAARLGIAPPLQDSGALHESIGAIVQGPAGTVQLEQGVILPANHLHCSPDDAARMQVRHGDIISLCLADDPRVVFTDVRVRVHPTYRMLFHFLPDASIPTFKKGLMAQRFSK